MRRIRNFRVVPIMHACIAWAHYTYYPAMNLILSHICVPTLRLYKTIRAWKSICMLEVSADRVYFDAHEVRIVKLTWLHIEFTST